MDKVKIGRTPEGTLFEVLTAIIVVLSLVLGFRLSDSASMGTTLVYDAIMTAVVIMQLVFAYHPDSQWVHMPVPVRKPRQLSLASRLLRVMALEIALMELALTIAFAKDDKALYDMCSGGFAGVLVVTILVFSILINRARRDRVSSD